VPVDDLAKQDGATVAELRHELAELVPGVSHRDRFRGLRHTLAGKDLEPFRPGKPRRVETEIEREFCVLRDPRIVRAPKRSIS